MARRKPRNTRGKSSNSQMDDKSKTIEGSESESQAQSSSPESKEGKNDVAWYARDPQLCVDAARIPFSLPFGANVPQGDYFIDHTGEQMESSDVAVGSYLEHTVPGVCSLVVKPSFGTNGKKTDPVNVCANAFYTHVRYMNSGRKNYDPADLFIYAATFGDLISFIVYCKRLYALAFMYSQRNYYVGRNMIEAQYVDSQDIINNLANFRYLINTWINKVSSFCLPGDIYYFSRRAFMFGNFYIENNFDNLKDQMYLFSPDGFYKFDINGNGSGMLKYSQLGFTASDKGTVSKLSDYFDSLFENITGDEDFGIMSGDILKAYGDNRIFMTSLGEDATLAPIHDPYVLSQFKNAVAGNFLTNNDFDRGFSYSIPGSSDTFAYGDLVQVPGDGNLYSREAIFWDDDLSQYTDHRYIDNQLGMQVLAHANLLLSSENPAPDVGDVIEASRLMVSPTSDAPKEVTVMGGEKFWVQEVNTGTEIVVGINFCYINHDSARRETLTVQKWNSNTMGDAYFGRTSANRVHIHELRTWAEFKYAPMLRLISYEIDPDNPPMYKIYSIDMLCNTDNMAVLSHENVKRLHEVALLSLFFVPGVAKIL